MKIKIHDTTYIFLLISFLAGYFELTYLLLLNIFIHESGHYIFALLNKIKILKIIIYPVGGITILDCDLNISIKKELICLFGGITFQIIFLFLIKKMYDFSLITEHVYTLNLKINIFLISFNFLPIIPLDGGKLVNLLLDKILPYKYSDIFSIVISFVFIIIFLIKDITILSVIISVGEVIFIGCVEDKTKDFCVNEFKLFYCVFDCVSVAIVLTNNNNNAIGKFCCNKRITNFLNRRK